MQSITIKINGVFPINVLLKMNTLYIVVAVFMEIGDEPSLAFAQIAHVTACLLCCYSDHLWIHVHSIQKSEK